MKSDKRRLVIVMSALVVLTACGGGTQSVPAASTPIFTSTPLMTAAKGVLYDYQVSATDPAGGAVTLSLTTAPTGATFSSNTISWTPTAVQSRVADNFVVTAKTSEGGSATQSWNVTPSGTVNGSKVDTFWTAAGPVNVPFDWTKVIVSPRALVPDSDGSILVLTSSVNSDGTFNIPNVPGGYYWLQFGGEAFWTSSSTFDLGTDFSGQRISITAGRETTTFDFNVTGLDPVQSQDQFAFVSDLDFPPGISTPLPIVGSTTLVGSTQSNGNLDFSRIKTGFLLQYEPEALGSISGVALGPELTLSNLSFTDGTTNTIAGTLVPSPRSSFDLSVTGSKWAPLFDNVGSAPATPVGADLSVSVEPFITGQNVMPSPSLLRNLSLPLFFANPVSNTGGFEAAGSLLVSSCPDATSSSLLLPAQPPILSDQSFGTLQYGDPFPSAWPRVFAFCETASVQIPVPGASSTSTFLLGYGESTMLPTSPISPLTAPVQNPTINGSSLFSANTLNTVSVTLSWSQPDGMVPYGYQVVPFGLMTLPDGSPGYLAAGRFFTAKTSVTLPTLEAGKTYVFAITAKVDGRANVEASPLRSALPTAFASVVSAPITISPWATGQIIHRAAAR